MGPKIFITTRGRRRPLGPAALLAAASIVATCVPSRASAQAVPGTPGPAAQQVQDQVRSPADPDTDYAPPPAPPARIPGNRFVMPDLSDNAKNYTSYDGRWFSTALSIVPLVDYNAFVQDS